MLWELPRWIRPDIVCTEARNSGFVVYTSSTMEPSTSFTVNWKSNPLTNSWIKGGRGREGGRPRDNDITSPVISVGRFCIECCDESFTSRWGRNSTVSSRRGKGKHPRIQRFWLFLSLSLSRRYQCFVSTKIRSRGRKTKGETSKGMWRVVFVTVLLTIRDNGNGQMFIFSAEIVTSVREQVKTREMEQLTI